MNRIETRAEDKNLKAVWLEVLQADNLLSNGILGLFELI
jgi:hypothetical protein